MASLHPTPGHRTEQIVWNVQPQCPSKRNFHDLSQCEHTEHHKRQAVGSLGYAIASPTLGLRDATIERALPQFQTMPEAMPGIAASLTRRLQGLLLMPTRPAVTKGADSSTPATGTTAGLRHTCRFPDWPRTRALTALLA